MSKIPWDESEPTKQSPARNLDEYIREETKKALRQRLSKEHAFTADGDEDDVGEHKEGSARIGFGAPGARPGNNSDNPGSLYLSTGSGINTLTLDDGSHWRDACKLLQAGVAEHNLDTSSMSSGYYIRHWSGWQECIQSGVRIEEDGSIWRLVKEWEYPASFIEPPYVTGQIEYDASENLDASSFGTFHWAVLQYMSGVCLNDTPGTSSAEVTIVVTDRDESIGDGDYVNATLKAVGRWD